MTSTSALKRKSPHVPNAVVAKADVKLGMGLTNSPTRPPIPNRRGPSGDVFGSRHVAA
jgi:hypothetical protein